MIVYTHSRVTKRRDEVEDEDDNASRDNTDVASAPEPAEKPAERKELLPYLSIPRLKSWYNFLTFWKKR